MSLPISDFPIGSLWKRSEIHDRLGGNIQRGISSAAGKPYILIFSSPKLNDHEKVMWIHPKALTSLGLALADKRIAVAAA